MNTRRHPGYHRRREVRLWAEDQTRQDAQHQREFMHRWVRIAQQVALEATPPAADLFEAASDADGHAYLLRMGLH